jgi:hypothetical protein
MNIFKVLDKKDEKLKYKLVNYLENKCNNSKIRNITILNLFRALHITIPIFLLILTLYVNKKTIIMIILFFILVILLFYYLDGCFLTLLELKLSKNDNYTVIDIILELLDIEVTNKSRNIYTYRCVFTISILILLIYIYRFLL